MGKKIITALPILFFMTLILILGAVLLQGKDPKLIDSSLEQIPEFEAGNLDTSDIEGRAGLVNFFASWCAPCEAEHTVLMTLKKEHGVRIFGINYKDKPEKKEAFLKRLGSPYKKIGDDREGRAGIAWGITGVPETFVINKRGQILYHHQGPLTDDDIPALLEYLK